MEQIFLVVRCSENGVTSLEGTKFGRKMFWRKQYFFVNSTKGRADNLDVRFGVLNFKKFTLILQKILPHNSKISSPATNNSLPVI